MSRPTNPLSEAEVAARIAAIQDRSLVGLPREEQYAELQRRGLSEQAISKRLAAIAQLELSGDDLDEAEGE